MDIILSMSIFFVVVTMIFIAIALLLPEWMGITGKRAKKIIEEQRDTSVHSEQSSASNEETKTDSEGDKP
jgi:type II secretory pathway pseudopilin PulG